MGDDPTKNGAGDSNTPDPKDTNINNQGDNSGSSNSNSNALTDEQIELALKDERAFKHPRFKELNEQAKLAKKLQKEQEERETAALKDQEKWQELAQKNEEKAKNAEERLKQTAINHAVQMASIKKGVIDPEAVTKLMDTSKIEVDENGNITGLDETLDALLAEKPYLVGKSDGNTQKPIGSGSNPSGQTQTRKFKHSEIKDPKFFNEHEKEIMQALANNQIEDDLN